MPFKLSSVKINKQGEKKLFLQTSKDIFLQNQVQQQKNPDSNETNKHMGELFS
jgi:hypothetical protein